MDTTNSAYGDKLIRLDTFDTAVAVDPSAEDDAKRRFMTLISRRPPQQRQHRARAARDQR